MKNLRRTAAILAGIFGVTGGAAAVVVGCGGDDTIIGTGGPDSGGDTSTDSSFDSGGDTGIADSGSDAFFFDAGPPDLQRFYLQINETGCAWLQNCCGGPADFNYNACLDTFGGIAGGFLFTSPVQDPIDGGGNVTLDTAQANACFNGILALPCSGDFVSTQMKSIRDACNAAVVGNVPVGNDCQATIECQAPAHCEGAPAGTCRAAYDAGVPCVLAGDQPVDSLSRCGRGYTGEPQFCEFGDFDTVSEAGVCAAPGTDGTDCYSPYECQSWLCDTDNTSTCVSSTHTPIAEDGGACALFPETDGG